MNLQTIPEWTNLISALTWLVGAGSAYVTGQVLSYLAENWVTWHTLPTIIKKITPLVLAPVIAIAAKLLLDQAIVLEFLAPWYTIIAFSIVTYLATQTAHAAQVNAGYGIGTRMQALNKIAEEDSDVA